MGVIGDSRDKSVSLAFLPPGLVPAGFRPVSNCEIKSAIVLPVVQEKLCVFESKLCEIPEIETVESHRSETLRVKFRRERRALVIPVYPFWGSSNYGRPAALRSATNCYFRGVVHGAGFISRKKSL